MGFLNFFLVASMPVLKVLLITGLGSFLAKDGVGILGENARKCLNTVVFFVYSPALIGSNLAGTITWDSLVLLWYMPLNIVITFVIGSALGWALIKLTKVPQNLKGLVLGSCSAGNMGSLFLILVPATCKEKGSPFGAPDICYTYSMAYASLSDAIASTCVWTYVYNIVRVFSSNISNEGAGCSHKCLEDAKICGDDISETLEAYSTAQPLLTHHQFPISVQIKQQLRKLLESKSIKALSAPTTIGVIVGFVIGIVPQLRTLMIGATAPLRVIQDSASLIGNASVPTMNLILGGNLLRGLKGSGVKVSLIVGIVVVRYILMPLIGTVIVKGAIHLGLVHSDPLYQFVLLLQFSVPPAMNMGTITQLFGTGESECSVIMLWTYALASISLTLWSTFFMWLVA